MGPFVCLLAGLLLVSSPAQAYIDPGVLGVLYQAAYALIFGALAALILRPWQYLKGVFARLTGRGAGTAHDIESGRVVEGDDKRQ